MLGSKSQFSANNHLRLQAVSDALSITWLPHIIAADALHSGQVVELLPEYSITCEPLYLYYPSRRGISKCEVNFSDVFTKHL
ncbi:LysR substrate-binding domain-containing protein [Neisseria perflava]|uniref:LysR substrate-binding domain-containing protein n=1 Tax=Neisseria perflava TaxID=33053 RepID=UPI00201B006D|nr:LysR substrate-binding domain-containing protein [Neisseria perflava]MCL5079001.1 LysR substrate-binding domain-containing protein [Neisseria perflava]